MKIVDLLQSPSSFGTIVEDDGKIFVVIQVDEGYIAFETCKDDCQVLKLHKFLCDLAESRALAVQALFREKARKLNEWESLSGIGAEVSNAGNEGSII